ncbi:MAG: MBL fold metallo-hydrolase [Candidatus Saccharimonadales bacterium]
MEITYYGANCIKVTSKEVTILIDPITGEYGPDPKIKADVLLYSQKPSKDINSKIDFLIDSPGEYEIRSVMIDGIAARLHTQKQEEAPKGVIYTISHKDIRILVAGNIHPDIADDQLDRIDGVDALVVPVGGKGLTMDKEAAADFIRQFDPALVIPVHYDDAKTKYPMPQDKVDSFLQEVGATDASREKSIKISNRDISEDVKFVVLDTSG